MLKLSDQVPLSRQVTESMSLTSRKKNNGQRSAHRDPIFLSFVQEAATPFRSCSGGQFAIDSHLEEEKKYRVRQQI